MPLFAAGLWLFNPLSATVSVRGNAESVMSVLVLVCLKFLIDRYVILAGFVYALSVHFKIYPITFALAIYLFLGQSYHHGNQEKEGEGQHFRQKVSGWREILRFLLPNRDRAVFMVSSAITLAFLTSLFYFQ